MRYRIESDTAKTISGVITHFKSGPSMGALVDSDGKKQNKIGDDPRYYFHFLPEVIYNTIEEYRKGGNRKRRYSLGVDPRLHRQIY
jgi:hypothetical protein